MSGARVARAARRGAGRLPRRQLRALCLAWPLSWLSPTPVLAGAADFAFEPVLAAIQQVESAGRPWVIRDNATGQSLDLASRGQAEATAAIRLELGHSLDLGLYQINSVHLRRPGVSLATVFDTAVQRDLARTILAEFLLRARSLYGDTQLAWERAIGAYNDGHVESENQPYVARVLRVLGRIPLTRPDGGAAGRDASAWIPFADGRDGAPDPAPTPALSSASSSFSAGMSSAEAEFAAAARDAGAAPVEDVRSLLALLAAALALVILAGTCGTVALLRGLSLAALGASRALARPVTRPLSARRMSGAAAT